MVTKSDEDHFFGSIGKSKDGQVHRAMDPLTGYISPAETLELEDVVNKVRRQS